MKIFVYHTNEKISAEICSLLSQAGHYVTSTSAFQDIAYCVARDEPGMVVLGDTRELASLNEVTHKLLFQDSFNTTFFYIDEDPLTENLKRDLLQTVQGLHIRWLSQSGYESPEQYLDKELAPWMYVEKMNAQYGYDDFSGRIVCDTTRLQLQLAAAAEKHASATRYFRAVERTKARLNLDGAWRISQGSFRLYSYRMLIARYLSVLAHYWPDTDTSCFPLPQVSRHVEFVHAKTPLISHYLMHIVQQMGLKPDLVALLNSVLELEYKGSKKHLALHGIYFFGLAAYLQSLCKAQIAAMSRLIHPKQETFPIGQSSAFVGRAFDLFCQAWELYAFQIRPDLMTGVARTYAHHPGRVEFERPFFPTFAEWAAHSKV